jgi:two-component system, cell cycle sensor histidine kinase and response regulator CckA
VTALKQEDIIFRKQSQTLFEQTPAILFDQLGHIVELNAAAAAALNSTPDVIVGRTLHQCGFVVRDLTGRKLGVPHHPWSIAIRTRSTIRNAITSITLPGGKCIWQQSACVPCQRIHRKKAFGALTIFTDISNLMELQTRSIQNQRMDAVAALTGGLTHDFNNILSSIRSTVQLMMLDAAPNDPRSKSLKDIENETMRGSELIRRLMLFTKPLDHSRNRTPLNQHISSLRHLIRRTIPANIHINYDLSKDDLLCPINPTSFEQVLLNLIINARDAMPEGGCITIATRQVSPEVSEEQSTRTRHKYAELTITDTGHGIAEELLPRIFDPFFTTKRDSGGTGLGLAIVHNLVHRSGGTVIVQKACNQGAAFTVTWPARICRHKASARQAAASENHTIVGDETILVVDDEALITRATAGILERHGYTVLKAFDGKSSIELFKANKNKISVVLLDMEMPDISGRQCLEQMLAMKPGQKIIMLSGHLFRPNDWKPTEAGASLFVQKPFDSAFLLHQIRNLIDGAKYEKRACPVSPCHQSASKDPHHCAAARIF